MTPRTPTHIPAIKLPMYKKIQTCDLFIQWCTHKCPDMVSRKVLTALVLDYTNGNPDPLFGKMAQLEADQCFELCQIFKSMLDHVGLNEAYLAWLAQNPRQ